MRLLIDTNVPIVANQRGIPDVSNDCIDACEDLLLALTNDQHQLILDYTWDIVDEYQNKLNSSGQPGIGDAFLRWILVNQRNPQRCEFVQITPHPRRRYVEFPDDPALADFDPSDRKFVAAALAHGAFPPIVNATDSDWRYYQTELAAHDVQVQFLCEADIQKIIVRKGK